MSELAAAYEVSQLTHDYHPDSKVLDAIVAAGKFAVVSLSAAYCRFTDATLPGQNHHACADRETLTPMQFDTLEAARAAATQLTDAENYDGEIQYYAYGPEGLDRPKIPYTNPKETSDTDCPFF